MSDRSLPPTPRRLREAREKGQFARSRAFSSLCTLMGGVMGLRIASGELGGFQAWTVSMLGATRLDGALEDAARRFGRCVLPVAVGVCLGALVSGVLAVGLDFRPERLTPKLEHFDVRKGLGKLFAWRNVAEAGKAAAVWVALTAVAWAAWRSTARELLATASVPSAHGFLLALGLLSPWMATALTVTGVFALGDLALSRYRHARSLRMSRVDYQREFKDSEGDPRQKAERKAAHRQLGAGGPARGLAAASALVVNPTHVAVALRWAPEDCDAPYLVAKGSEDAALELKRQAALLGIPIVKDVPLARTLIHYDVGEAVPEELYRAAAAVLKTASEFPSPSPETR